MEKPTIICLTPVRNEAWILDRFLKSASLWADHIIIADQMSTDGSREIAKKYSKVILIDNCSDTFNEPERQKLLIDEARKIIGPRLLITLDADEIFTPDILTSSEFDTILNSPPGTIFKFQLANIRPDLLNMWLVPHFSWGYMDDGFQHDGTRKIHSARIPLPLNHDILKLNQIKVIHFQYTNWKRMQSKHRWYQCFEIINFPTKSAVDIFRMYHHMYAIPQKELNSMPKEWINEYNKLGIDITSVLEEDILWWDEQVVTYIELYGANYFKKLHIWDVDWELKAKFYGNGKTDIFKDPRSKMDKYLSQWLIKTQKNYHNLIFRAIDKFIKVVFHY